MHAYTLVRDHDLAWKGEGITPPKRERWGVPVRMVIEAILLVLIVIALSVQLTIWTPVRPRGPNEPLKDCEFEWVRRRFEYDYADTPPRSWLRRQGVHER
jgi:hypothetical protein